MNEQILDKVKKLLALSASDNENESVAAIALANRLMEKHNINEAMLATDINASGAEAIRAWDEPIFGSEEKSRSQWRSGLAQLLAQSNNCEVWTRGGALFIIGRANDVNTVRYFFKYCEEQIERLSKQYKGKGKSWINNYKLGILFSIKDKLAEGKKKVQQEMVSEYGSRASNAIIKLDEKALETKKWANKYFENLNMKGSKSFGKQSVDYNARNIGYTDGKENINLGSGQGLGGGHRGLPGRR